MKKEIECVLLDGRFVPYGGLWPEPADAYCCIHGVKLRWQCDDCDEERASQNKGTNAREAKQGGIAETNSESVPCSDCRFRHDQLHCGYCTRSDETEYGDYYEKE